MWSAHHKREAWTPLIRPGSKVLYALSCYLRLILKHSHKKYWGKKIKISRSEFKGGVRLLRPPPPWILHCYLSVYIYLSIHPSIGLSPSCFLFFFACQLWSSTPCSIPTCIGGEDIFFCLSVQEQYPWRSTPIGGFFSLLVRTPCQEIVPTALWEREAEGKCKPVKRKGGNVHQ